MTAGGRRVRILDPRLFVRKLVLLLVFSALFLPLKYYELETSLKVYIAALLLLHVYFVFILIHRVRWKVLAEDRRSFLLRLLAVGLFIALLARQTTGATFIEFVAFLGISLVIHTGLLLTLTVTFRGDATSGAVSADV